jgi:Topoisomerase IA
MLGKKAGNGSENIMNVNKGDTVTPKLITILDERTTPPKPYTEATLLTAMENVDRQLSNNALKSVMKEAKGIGTPATRSNIIENIIKTGYITRDKKNLKPTEKGVNLIKIVPEKLKTPDFTAE